MIKFEKMPDESMNQFFYRLCQAKELNNYTWPDITDIMNNTFDLNFSESKYRKDWNSFGKIFNDNVEKITNCNSDIQQQITELQKAKKQLSDQRREYNKLILKDARREHIEDYLIEEIKKLPKLDCSPLFIKNEEVVSLIKENEAVLFLSDWHYGMVTDNIWNKYNVDICKERIQKLFSKVLIYLELNQIRKLDIVLLGDMINGSIHCTSRVASEENTCEQLIHVSEIIANFIDSFVKEGYFVNVYSTYGNHARSIQNKEDSIHSDNMERLIPFWLKQRFSSSCRVRIHDNTYYEFIFFNVCGYNIVCTHGDLDKFQDLGMTLNSLFTKKFGICIDYTFSGDKHHMEAFEQYNIESTLVGSLCGTDEFANNKRLYSNPFQTLCIFSQEDGKMCTYNIKL